MPSFNRVVIKGSHPLGEVWSWSVAFAHGGAGSWAGTSDPDALDDAAQALATGDRASIVPTYFYGLWGPATVVTGVRVESYDTTGKLNAASEYTPATSRPGTGANGMPPQTALAVTLNYGARYGRSGRGRFFLPLTASGLLAADLQLTNEQTGSILTASGQWLSQTSDTLDEAFGQDVRPGVYSRKLNQFTELGTLSVGSVVDTQRRRRDALSERRSTGPYVD